MKLLVDMNLSPAWVEFLDKYGFEAMHWSSIGSADAPDVEIMAYARRNEMVVVTHDLDFGAILSATHWEKPSVIQVRTAVPTPEKIGALLVLALRQMTAELERGALLTIDPRNSRLRFLPLPGRG